VRDEIDARHRAAIEAGEAGYLDPETGLFVLTARYLADRGTCCGQGCRHCPYGRGGDDVGTEASSEDGDGA
jgi:hypothetical protein